MSKTARLYQDTRNVAGGSNLDKLNDELQDVTRIMTKNMEELLWRGDSLDRKFTPNLMCISPSDPFHYRDVALVDVTAIRVRKVPQSGTQHQRPGNASTVRPSDCYRVHPARHHILETVGMSFW